MKRISHKDRDINYKIRKISKQKRIYSFNQKLVKVKVWISLNYHLEEQIRNKTCH